MLLKSGRALHFVHFLAPDACVRTVVLLHSADKAQTPADFFFLWVSVIQETQQEHNELK